MTLPFDTFGPEGGEARVREPEVREPEVREPHMREAEVREAWILHGILGSRRNWRAFTRNLAPTLPGWRIRTLDLRNHGDASPMPGPHTVHACAQDLVDTANALGRGPDVVIGHSFGGKVALALADLEPAWLKQICVLDSAPGPVDLPLRSGEQDDVVRLVGALAEIPLPIASHSALDLHLRELGFGHVLSSWMTTNLRAAPDGGLIWRFDLPGVRELLADYARWDAWPTIARTPVSVRLLQATRGDRWTPEVAEIAASMADGGRVSLEKIDAGHWVHVDAPVQLGEWLRAKLSTVL